MRISSVVVLAVVLSRPAWPCAIADPGELQTRVLDEEALLVFDEKNGLEHFIRSAEFQPGGASFGFIVPTPSAPTFAEIDQSVFAELRSSYEAARPHESKFELGNIGFLVLKGVAEESVRVIRSERVAGLDVTVLQANDGAALAGWLEQHGFQMRPALQVWLDDYAKRGYVFSAFRYASEAGASVTTKAVRITFATPTPMYPYREPSDSARRAGLRLWLVAPQTRDWVDGTSREPPLVVARTSTLKLPAALEALLPGQKVVTVFEDQRWSRPPADVEFVASSAAEVLPPHVDRTVIPVEGICCPAMVIAVVVLVVRTRRRR
jgi:hypothetical protein